MNKEKSTLEFQSIVSVGYIYLLVMGVLFALGIFGFYIGTGLGGGYKMSKKIKNGEIEYKDQIRFISGEQIQAKIVGTNSAYVFY